MKNLKKINSIGLLIWAAIIISLSGCATKKAAWGSMKKGMIMVYSLKLDRNLTYQNTYEFTQTFTVNGQEMSVLATGDQTLRMIPLVGTSEDLNYMVKIEEMFSKMNTQRGEMEAQLDDVVGKSFNLTISRMGDELEYSGAEALTYDLGNGEMKSISSDIQAFFPNLPGKPIMLGDSWESTESISEKNASGILLMSTNYVNTFVGLEERQGMQCMKIDFVAEGTLEGESESNGMNIETTGDIIGSGSWFFAYKEGIFVEQVINGEGNTVSEITGSKEMTLPAKRTHTMISVLVD